MITRALYKEREMGRTVLVLLLGVLLVLSCTGSDDFTNPSRAAQGLTVNVYNNTALAGVPLTSTVIPTLKFQYPAVVSSFEVLGTITLERGQSYAFYCEFNDTVPLAYLWIGLI